jgi:cell wall-associated NlpC family hydrolase
MILLPNNLQTLELPLDRESVGYYELINGKPTDITILTNTSLMPSNYFSISPKDTLMLSTKTNVVIFHTHINDNSHLSNEDIESSNRCGYPYLMSNIKTGGWDYYNPKEVPPLEGRKYSYSHSNCYTLVRDYYKLTYGRTLTNYKLTTPTAYLEDGWNEFYKYFNTEGFTKVDLPKQGDVLLLKIGKTGLGCEANHCGIYIEDNKILHHLSNNLSKIEPLTERLRRHITKIVRLT